MTCRRVRMGITMSLDWRQKIIVLSSVAAVKFMLLGIITIIFFRSLGYRAPFLSDAPCSDLNLIKGSATSNDRASNQWPSSWRLRQIGDREWGELKFLLSR